MNLKKCTDKELRKLKEEVQSEIDKRVPTYEQVLMFRSAISFYEIHGDKKEKLKLEKLRKEYSNKLDTLIEFYKK